MGEEDEVQPEYMQHSANFENRASAAPGGAVGIAGKGGQPAAEGLGRDEGPGGDVSSLTNTLRELRMESQHLNHSEYHMADFPTPPAHSGPFVSPEAARAAGRSPLDYSPPAYSFT